MNNQIENTQKHNFLLSLSVFKKLYDEKKDIYEIIGVFIRRELSKPGLSEFSLFEMTQKINEEYNFDIPQAMAKTSLHRLTKSGDLKLEHGRYTKLKDFEDINIIADDANSAKNEEEYIVEILKDGMGNNKLLDDDIKKSLESYFLNKNDLHGIFPYINACIIKNLSDKRFIDGLNEIKYGLILYEGISYGIETINPKKWNTKTIFLDTEILLYLGSYNGELFKKIATDFMSLIKIVNKTKKIVKLQFSEDVKNEMDSLFNVAELIIKKEMEYKPNEAIRAILDSCKSASDVAIKKADFYSFLSKLRIKEYEDQSYSDKKDHQYNLEHESDLDDKGQKHLKQLSHINILRQGNKHTTLDKIEYLLLTETRNTIELSKQNKGKDDFPLALRLSEGNLYK